MPAVATVETRCPEPGCPHKFVGTALRGRAWLEVHLRDVHKLGDGREALARMDRGEPQRPGLGGRASGAAVTPAANGDGGVSSAPPRSPSPSSGRSRKPKGYWTRERIVEAIQRWAREHDGVPPTSGMWGNAGAPPPPEGFPNYATVARAFGSWGKGIEAAGFPRPTSGARKPAKPEPQPKVETPAEPEPDPDPGIRWAKEEPKAPEPVTQPGQSDASDFPTSSEEPKPEEGDRGWADRIRDDALAAGVEITVAEPLPDANQRLMDSLGVKVTVKGSDPEPATALEIVSNREDVAHVAVAADHVALLGRDVDEKRAAFEQARRELGESLASFGRALQDARNAALEAAQT